MVLTPALHEKIATLIEENEIRKTQTKDNDDALRTLLTNLSAEEWICVQALTWLDRGHGKLTLEASIDDARDDFSASKAVTSRFACPHPLGLLGPRYEARTTLRVALIRTFALLLLS